MVFWDGGKKERGIKFLLTRLFQNDRYAFHSLGCEWSWREAWFSPLESRVLFFTEVQRQGEVAPPECLLPTLPQVASGLLTLDLSLILGVRPTGCIDSTTPSSFLAPSHQFCL